MFLYGGAPWASSYHTQCCQLLWVSPGHFVYALRDQVWCKDRRFSSGVYVDVLHCRTTALVAYLHLTYKKVRQLLVLNRKSQFIHTLKLIVPTIATQFQTHAPTKSFFRRVHRIIPAEPRSFYCARWLRRARSAAPRTEDSSCKTSLPLMKILKDNPTRGALAPGATPLPTPL